MPTTAWSFPSCARSNARFARHSAKACWPWPVPEDAGLRVVAVRGSAASHAALQAMAPRRRLSAALTAGRLPDPSHGFRI